MIEEIKIGQKNVHFARHNGKVVYPNYAAKENLVLWYDFSGRTNLDVNKGIAEDLSGNGNDGILENFAYESGSGYDSNSYLEFDNVDDFITIPELNLDVNNFTVAVDGEVLSYRGDNVAKINENGLEIGGRNYWAITKSPQHKYIKYFPETNTFKNTVASSSFAVFGLDKLGIDINSFYTLSFEIRVLYGNPQFSNNVLYVNGASPSTTHNRPTLILDEYVKVYGTFNYTAESTGLVHIYFNSGLTGINQIEFRNFQVGKGTKATDWTPVPEDFQTTKITPIFSNKIKTLMYWNRALTDEELLQVYNIQIKRTEL